jgi:ribosome-associated protein
LEVKRKQTRRKAASPSLQDLIIQSIQEKKGHKIVSLDLKGVNDAIADTFIICEADNTIQIKAIADNVMEQSKKTMGELPWHSEGMKRLEWVLIDYVDVVVHIFLPQSRAFYQLEELWHDAKLMEH